MYSEISVINCLVTTAPATEPVTLAQVKEYLKLDSAYTDEDTLLNTLIASARIFIENRIGRSIISQVRTQYMDEFGFCDEIGLLFGPLISVGDLTVKSVKYYDTNDTLQTISSSDYWIDSTSDIPRIVIKNSWPSIKSRPNAVQIEFNAGYATTEAGVPKDIKDAMFYYIAQRYENRVPENLGMTVGKFELTIDAILAQRRAFQNGFINTNTDY